MKALSIRAPWWWFILFGSKDVENRNWRTGYRGPVLIHASKTIIARDFDKEWALARRIQGEPQPLAAFQWDEMKRGAGCIVGVAEIVDCVGWSDSPWFFGDYGIVLRSARAVAAPVPCKGALGLFEVGAAVADAVMGHAGGDASAVTEDDPAWVPAPHLGGPR